MVIGFTIPHDFIVPYMASNNIMLFSFKVITLIHMLLEKFCSKISLYYVCLSFHGRGQ
jgi:hypothetical protein